MPHCVLLCKRDAIPEYKRAVVSVYQCTSVLAFQSTHRMVVVPSATSAPAYHTVSRDHNTKRAKLSIDVCAMFVVAKAIFSNFAIARARLSNKRTQSPRANGPVRAQVKNANPIVWARARVMAKLLKIALDATNIAQTSMLSFALLVLWSLDCICRWTRVLARNS